MRDDAILYYWISDGGDGSANVQFYTKKQDALLDCAQEMEAYGHVTEEVAPLYPSNINLKPQDRWNDDD